LIDITISTRSESACFAADPGLVLGEVTKPETINYRT
jgi:hypothetical protein